VILQRRQVRMLSLACGWVSTPRQSRGP
jgi:hypothetical protein